MIIQPKIRGFICTAAHPLGCFKAVQAQVNYVKKKGFFMGPKNVLVIGASTGYGLASRIVAAFGAKASTIGVSYERPADQKRTASPGWYNTAAFEQLAKHEGYLIKSINGDAFSHEVKHQTINYLKHHSGPIDLLIYSLASPRRIHPDSGETFNSVIKPIGQSYRNKTVDPVSVSGVVKEIEIEPANSEEIASTQAVMGGEDWQMWIEQLLAEGLLADKMTTLAYSYIGPELTHPIYKNGTIGAAKRHLHNTALTLNQQLASIGGKALISINKALVTQASSAIPVVPLYISLLYKIMKAKGTHEGCIEQMDRLFRERLHVKNGPIVDQNQYIRLDDWEMDPEVQSAIAKLWPVLNSENLDSLADVAGYREEFYHLFGFGFPEIDYNIDVDPEVYIPSMDEKIQVL